MATREDGTPWWTAFPEPQSQPQKIEPGEVWELLEKQTPENPRDFLLVDVRRTDYTGGTIATSINLPAHSFYPTRRTVYDLCKQAGISRVIFYCGSSNGRGPRCAAWLQDLIDEAGDTKLRSLVMTGGIRGWVKSYGGRLMDAYDEKAWEEKQE